MEKLLFELSNEQRTYLGLIPVEKHWELVKLNDMFLYFDGDVIRKKINVNVHNYHEEELCETTAENKTLLLPKTAKGKPKKLNYTATQSFSPFGVYFSFSERTIRIANYTTQTTFYSESFQQNSSLEDLTAWLHKWVHETTANDLNEIELFKQSKRIHAKFKEGDFFTFKIGRRQWGFGRILMDVDKRKKTDNLKATKNYGLTSFAGKPLLVKVYHKISDTQTVNLAELAQTGSLPTQAVMDNNFYYGEHKIIGHRNLHAADFDDALISYGRSISGLDRDTVYIQYGIIFKETTIAAYDKYLRIERKDKHALENPYRNEGIGFSLTTGQLLNCIEAKSNKPYWDHASDFDLRNPKNSGLKKEIFHVFGLDPDKSYVENLALAGYNEIGGAE